MASNPMTQFNVHRIGPEIKIGTFDISFTNASLFMIISSVAILIVFNLGSKKKSLIPNKIQLLAELSYTFVSKMISDTAGLKAKPYFAFIFSLFMFVLFCNMFGMIPYWRNNYWIYETWFWIFKIICAKRGSCGTTSADCSY